MAEPVDKTSDAVGTAEDVDTSLTEEQAEAAFDDNLTWDDGEDDGSESEDEVESEAATEEDTEDEEESGDDVESPDSEQDQEPAADSTTDADDEAARKQHNQEMAQRRIQEREAKRQKQLQDQEQYLQGADDATDQALRQLQIDAYNNRVMMVTNDLKADVIAARDSIDLFTHENPVIREAMASALDEFEAMHIQKDEYGNPTAVTGDVRQYLQLKADSIRQLTGIGKQEQVKAKQKQQRRATPTPSKSPPKAKVDPDLAAFDDEASSW